MLQGVFHRTKPPNIIPPTLNFNLRSSYDDLWGMFFVAGSLPEQTEDRCVQASVRDVASGRRMVFGARDERRTGLVYVFILDQLN